MFFKKRLKKSTPEEDEKFAEMMDECEVDFKDKLAMVISAFIVIVLPCLLILIGLCLVACLLLGLL